MQSQESSDGIFLDIGFKVHFLIYLYIYIDPIENLVRRIKRNQGMFLLSKKLFLTFFVYIAIKMAKTAASNNKGNGM